MTDQNIPAVTDDDRRLAYEWAKSVEANLDTWGGRLSAPARVILDAVPAPPTLADMTMPERRACNWMQCDVEGQDGEWMIIDPFDDEDHAHVVGRRRGNMRIFQAKHVTPRPDLPRMEWDGDQKPEGDHDDLEVP